MRPDSTRLRSDSGQSILEFAMMLPLVVALVLGVVELSQQLTNQPCRRRVFG